jgi:hypothetical protein
MKNNIKLFWNVLMRIVAAFTASALGVIGAGAVAHISTLKAMTVAGLTACATVVEKLARGFMDDGKLSMDEINAAFAAVDTQAQTAADLQVQARQSGTDLTVSAADGSVTPVVAPAAPAAPAVESAPEAPEAPAVTADATPAAPVESAPEAPEAPAVPNDPHYN